MRYVKWCMVGIFICCIIATGCATTTTTQAFETDESQVQLRSMQTRAYDITDKSMMMQTVISTMQDLDFVLDKAESGSIMADSDIKASADRRQGTDRRKIANSAYVEERRSGQDRRSGLDRRRGVDRRSGADRRSERNL